MITILTTIFSFLGGPLLTSVVNAYQARLNAMTSANGMSVDLAKAELEAQIQARKDATAILMAEQGHWYTACIRSLFALPYVAYAWVVVLWVACLRHQPIPQLPDTVSSWGSVIIAAYFGEHIVSQVTRIIKR